MGHSPDGILFYGYAFPFEFDVPEEIEDDWQELKNSPVELAYSGYEGSTPFVAIKSANKLAYGYDIIEVNLGELLSSLPANANELIIEFAKKYNLPLPGQEIYPDDEYSNEKATEIGWWLTSNYG